MDKDNKELLLLEAKNPKDKSKIELAGEDSINKWSGVEQGKFEEFIKGIVTPKTSSDNESEQIERFRSLISGVPSPWARVMLTREAVNTPKDELKDSLLDQCYKALKSEWRGLIAAYVLRQEKFVFSNPIPLVGESAGTSGKLDIRNIYGEMLFNERVLYLHKKNQKEDKEENPPCIQILYYKKNEKTLIPVAATSPYTLLFAGVNYFTSSNDYDRGAIPWIRNNKFYDPTTDCPEFEKDDMRRLAAFLGKMGKNISNEQDRNPDKYYRQYIEAICDKNENADLKMKFGEIMDAFVKEISAWKEEIEDLIGNANGSEPILTFDQKPAGPLALLLNTDTVFYYEGNKLKKESGGKELLSSQIFMDSPFIAAWSHTPENGKDFNKLSAYYVIGEDKHYAFPVPFTPEALSIFEKELEAIVGNGNDIRLSAKVRNEKDGMKTVEFQLLAKWDGEFVSVCKKGYTMNVIPESRGKCFVWPDFRSPKWDRYYFYSEFPENSTGIRMIPYFREYIKNEIPQKKDSDQKEEQKVSQNPPDEGGSGNVLEGGLASAESVAQPSEEKNEPVENVVPAKEGNGTYLVEYPKDASSQLYKYEVRHSSMPLHRIKIVATYSGKEIDLGFLVVKFSDNEKDTSEGNISKIEINENLKAGSVGIDFGSTNTCAYYNDGNSNVKPIPFKNRRKALVGFDAPKGALASKNELLFISNEETLNDNGQVKSWLHLHRPEYKSKSGDKIGQDTGLVGGVPVNERNILISQIDESNIITNAGTLWYNMKWASNDSDKKRKKSFMRMLWIQICADMLAEGVRPKTLLWSYPGAMDSTFAEELFEKNVDQVFSSPDLQISEFVRCTEAKAASAYASATDIGDENNLRLGIDIGGSTSDIHILRRNPDDKNHLVIASLSSVRLASGFFFRAINGSKSFRRCIYDFHNDFKCDHPDLYIANIEDILTDGSSTDFKAPYYLNALFDRLNKRQDCTRFYVHLRDSIRPIFAYPAFVTGVLLYYSGMLARNVVKKNGIDLKVVQVRGYGNGGRLFDWILDIFGESGSKEGSKYSTYYEKCFRAGIGMDDVKVEFLKKEDGEDKSEVAKGLVSGKFEDLDSVDASERFDIVGEKGIISTADNQEMTDVDLLSDKLFDGGVCLKMPEKLENFGNFIDIYTDFLLKEHIVGNTTSLKNGKDNLPVISHIQNDPEYIRYRNSKDENKNKKYCMPIFIASALCYLKEVLLPEVSKQINND